MATTQVQYTISGPTDKTHAYGSIEMPPDGLSIVDSDLLVVTINGSTLTLTTDYTVDSANENIIIDAGYTVADQDVLVISRATDIDLPYVDFTNNTTVDAEEIDLALLQLRFRLQELETDLGDLITYNASLGYWDGKDRKTQNFMPATSLSGLVTLGQLQSELSGTETATVDEVNYAVRSGDGVTTSYALSGFPITDVNDESFLVFVSGVKQRPTTDFSVAVPSTNVLTVTFVTAPPSGTNNIEIMTYKGTVQTGLDEGTLNGNAIIDQTLDVDALDDDGAAANSYLKTDGAGNNSWDVLTHDDITDWDAEIALTSLSDLAPPTGTLNMNNAVLSNVAAPGANLHAANKKYVDDQISALATNPAGTVFGMEPYDTDGSAKFTTSLNSQTLTGLTAGTYLIHVHTDGVGGSPTVTAGGVTREAVGSGPSVSFYVTTASTSISITSSNCSIRNISYMRVA